MRSFSRSRSLVAGLAFAGLAVSGSMWSPARSADPATGTLGPDTGEVRWQGGPIPGQTVGFGGVGCPLGELDPTCDGFTLTVADLTAAPEGKKKPKKNAAPAPVLDDVHISIAGRNAPGLIAEFDLYVYDAAGTEVGRSTDLGSNDVVVLIDPPAGDYRVYVQNVLSVDLEATYDAAARVHDSSQDPIDIEPTRCGFEGLPLLRDEPTGIGILVGDPSAPVDGLDAGDPIALDLALVLDGITEEDARALVARSSQSYLPLNVDLRVASVRHETFVDEQGQAITDASALIRLAKERLGGARPAGSDIVGVLTSRNIQQLGQTAVAGLADCIGGVAHADRAFFVAEAFPAGDIAIGPAVFQANATANILAHEVGHLMGGQHHYANCVEGIEASDVHDDGTFDASPCTLMFNAADFLGANFGTVNATFARGSASRYARP